ncbi:BlaI/MecI/CopY family transcriptional regulator [Clostridium tetani]|uniref:BlaI/MecI/CopY family transcriptional regulator n=1 Tax=Clostridium tetani TaxID=1513 RepID=A0ABC8ED48_CLOTA|nr:BlaI/MecI/CopY family transcriptional regulator [Clostridium tetani]KGI41481.1 CopY family transcriptional regulator [Clostridium tetani]KHO39159.1 CopY family transcriptional regulator [Clostridium tetani]RXI38166.1 BlaI/MecI/CopY family transcriptional regulator [Clostridium tetani]RXI51221.1 BlaI/MecI/CopY family transcriptional regulator [Clostridium tetani]RXI65943.1 BlaI/MecI/CopY family transcriptional regulator [Clostridium tetani]
MNNFKIFDAEFKFMEIVWENSPIKSSDLVKLTHDKLGWKKSTTYTVIRRLKERNIIANENAIVTALIDREAVQLSETEELIDKVYSGSIKKFFSTFLQKENLSKKDIKELKKIVDELE